jgi:hypothetical protein
MYRDRDDVDARDRERLLEQLSRAERDLTWRIEQHAPDRGTADAAVGDAPLRKRLSFLLRSLKGRIAAVRAEVDREREAQRSQ